MGFCTEEQCEEFFRSVPEFERMLVRSGIILIKYWFSITDEEQQFRFLMRIHDPLKQWKLSPMDVQSRALGVLYQGQGRDAPSHAHYRGTVVGSRGRRQKSGHGSTAFPICSRKFPITSFATSPSCCRSGCAIRPIIATRSRRTCTCPRSSEPVASEFAGRPSEL
jgi:hypothetical protein